MSNLTLAAQIALLCNADKRRACPGVNEVGKRCQRSRVGCEVPAQANQVSVVVQVVCSKKGSKSMTKTFTVTTEHIKLLRLAYVAWDDCDFGAPGIDPKRPYGNSYVYGDIAEILGVLPADKDDEFTQEQEDFIRQVHRETLDALQIFLVTGEIREGNYARADKYDHRSWHRVGE